MPQLKRLTCCAEVPGHPKSVCHLKKGHKGRHYANLPGPERPRARWSDGDTEPTYTRTPQPRAVKVRRQDVSRALEEACSKKLKTSLTLDSDLLKWVDSFDTNRSAFVNSVLRMAKRSWEET